MTGITDWTNLSSDDLYNNLRVFEQEIQVLQKQSFKFYAIFHFFNQYSKKKFLLILKQMDINWKIAMIAIRLKKFYRENRKEMFAWMEKRCWIDKKSLYVSIVTTLVYFAKRMYIKGDTEGKKKRSTHSINIRSWESKCRNQMALMTMDDEIVNWREHP
ncbi:hypothetical protein Tco_0764003 [Tanacetum coccineum]